MPKDTIEISGISLLKLENKVIVTVEYKGVWIEIITEYVGNSFGVIVEPSGIRKAIAKKFDLGEL